jgi:hypothetical protein
MLKFLFYIFVFYVIFRFIFSVLFKGAIKSRTVHFERHPPQEDVTEGSIKVKPPVSSPKPRGDNKNLGEYVDYEEVK